MGSTAFGSAVQRMTISLGRIAQVRQRRARIAMEVYDLLSVRPVCQAMVTLVPASSGGQRPILRTALVRYGVSGLGAASMVFDTNGV